MKLTFKYVSQLAKEHGYIIEKNGKKYSLFSNDKMPGVEIIENSLKDIYGELYMYISSPPIGQSD